jgi:hypothetical protein
VFGFEISFTLSLAHDRNSIGLIYTVACYLLWYSCLTIKHVHVLGFVPDARFCTSFSPDIPDNCRQIKYISRDKLHNGDIVALSYNPTLCCLDCSK